MEEILKRIESKLGRILELIEDKTLTDEEIRLLREADEIARKRLMSSRYCDYESN